MRYLSRNADQARFDVLREGTPLPPGSFYRDTPAGFLSIRVSHVTITGDFVEYQIGDIDAMSHPRRSDADDLLRQFTRIATAEDVVRFVERWGPIGFCADHQLPYEHSWGPQLPGASADHFEKWYEERGTRPEECQAPWWIKPARAPIGSESIGVYMRFADQSRGIMLAASALRAGRQPTDEEWLAATVGWNRRDIAKRGESYLLTRRAVHRLFTGEVAPHETADGLDSQKWWWQVLGSLVNEWIAISGVRPRIGSWTGDPQVRFVTSPVGIGLFGTLAMQLLRAVTGHMAPEICDGCGEAYLPANRRPKRNQKHWCPECRKKGVPTREWRAAQQERKGDGHDE
ncbi:MAG: hypothetical protein O3C10_09355 [Chloroflexi bacterium]|nr:hypothetical protein [Chloroflexota bacterium]